MGRSPPRGRRRRAAHGGKQPRSGAHAQQAAAAPPASKYKPLYKSGNVSLSSTGLASKLDRQTKKCMRAARALMKRKLEVRVEASNAGCSVDALADELLADLEADFHRQLEEVRRVEYALKNGQFTEWSLEEALKNSAKSTTSSTRFDFDHRQGDSGYFCTTRFDFDHNNDRGGQDRPNAAACAAQRLILIQNCAPTANIC